MEAERFIGNEPCRKVPLVSQKSEVKNVKIICSDKHNHRHSCDPLPVFWRQNSKKEMLLKNMKDGETKAAWEKTSLKIWEKEKKTMEANRVQIRLNPKKERDQKVMEKLRRADRAQRDYILDAILAYQEQAVLEEDTLRRILREELQHTGIQREALPEPGRLEAGLKEEKKQTEPVLADVEEEQNPMGEKALSLLTAFDSMD